MRLDRYQKRTERKETSRNTDPALRQHNFTFKVLSVKYTWDMKGAQIIQILFQGVQGLLNFKLKGILSNIEESKVSNKNE